MDYSSKDCNNVHSIAVPPEDYPRQEDYAAYVIRGKELLRKVDDAFLHGDISEAQRLSGDLLQLGFDLTKLASVLLIERNNRDNQANRRKYQPTSAEIIRRSVERAEREKAEYEAAQLKKQTRHGPGFYEATTPGLPKEYPGNGDGSGGTGESGG